MTDRDQTLMSIQHLLRPQIEKLYRIRLDDLHLQPGYQGCQNLVFYYSKDSAEPTPADYVLRVSFRKDRPPEQIEAELDFVLFLFEHGVRVSPPVRSQEGRYAEVLWVNDTPLTFVSFIKAPGHRLPDRGYRYRDGVSIQEYFHNWGNTLGQMHRLTQQYSPGESSTKRPLLLDNLADHYIPSYLPPSLEKVRERFCCLIDNAKLLPRGRDAFGLIHADFNDGNFCVDYCNGNITVFDFDDSAYCWFMYDLASAWRAGTGWIQFEKNVSKRRAFMDKYFETLLEGYTRENGLPEEWLERLPMFIKLIEMESLLDEYRYMCLEDDGVLDDKELAYSWKCIEEDIPFFGFFDTIYSHEHPFQLP